MFSGRAVFTRQDFEREAQFVQALHELSLYALSYSRSGDLVTAENIHRLMLGYKEANRGPNSVEAALTRNELGEILLRQGRLDEAEVHLRVAVDIRNAHQVYGSDAAYSRDNLARVLETKGKCGEARAMRLSVPTAMVCGYTKVRSHIIFPV
jgi:tetratricopeptide (TPR) repeat protein